MSAGTFSGTGWRASDSDVLPSIAAGAATLIRGWVEFVTEFGFEGLEEGFGGPAEAHEEVFDAGASAVFAELLSARGRFLAAALTTAIA